MGNWLARALSTGIFWLALPASAVVRFEGLLEADVNKLKAEFLGIESMVPAPSDLDKMIRSLMGNQNYASLEALRIDAKTYALKGKALKRVQKINVRGASAVDEIDILNALDLKTDAEFNENRMARGAEKLQELYGRQGYFNASFTYSFSEKDPTSLELDVEIKEGLPCRILEIEFESTNQALVRKLKRKLKGFKNDIFTEEALLELERGGSEFLREQRYLNAKIEQKDATYNREKTTARLVYTLKDVYRYDFNFFGNTSISRADLLRPANLDDFDAGSVDPSADVVHAAALKYLDDGYAFSKLSYVEKVDEKNFTRRVDVTVVEGHRVKIEKYDVTGRISRSPSYYAHYIEDNSSPTIDDGYFVRQHLDVGLKNLIISLNNEGFLKARIQSVRYEPSEDRKTVRVKLVLDEGPLTQLRGIAFEGNAAFSTEQLLEVLKIKPNSPLQLNKLEDSIEALVNYYFSRGYIEMRLDNQDDQIVQYDERGAQANVIFKIYEGPRVEVQNIIVEGNTFTKDSVILRKLEIEPGQLVTPDIMNEGRRRLENLSIFTRVELRTLEANSMVSKRTLIVSVTEANPGVMKIGGGVNNKNDLTLRGFTAQVFFMRSPGRLFII